jgi:hypothetical protein
MTIDKKWCLNKCADEKSDTFGKRTSDRKMGRHHEAHRAVKEIIVLNDAGEIDQKYHIDNVGHLVASGFQAGVAFACPSPGRPPVDRQFTETHAPPIPMIHRTYPPIRTLQTPDENDPFYAPRFQTSIVYDSRDGAKTDFEPWEPNQ